MEVEEMMALAEDKAYIEAVETLERFWQESRLPAKRAGIMLRQLEKQKGEDLDGDHVIGVPAPVVKKDALGAPMITGRSGKTPRILPLRWSLLLGMLNCDGSIDEPHTRKCQWCGQSRTNESPVTAFADQGRAEPGKTAKTLISRPVRHRATGGGGGSSPGTDSH